MSTSRIPPVPPNKGGELDKTAPTSQHRKVEKVEKVSKVAEVDDESRARQFRQFVEAEDEEESNLPTPFAIFAVSSEPGPVAPMGTLSSGSQETADTASPSPAYSSPPSTSLNSTAMQDEQEASPLPQSDQFWGSVEESAESNQPSMQPQMEETSGSASRIFLSSEDTNQQTTSPPEQEESQQPPENNTVVAPKKKRKGSSQERIAQPKGPQSPSPFGPPGKPSMRDREEHDRLLSGKKETAKENQKEMESLFFPREEGKKRKIAGPEGVIAPKGEEGLKYIGPLPSHKKGAESDAQFPSEERTGHQLARSLREEEKDLPTSFKRSDEGRGGKKDLKGQETAFGELARKQEKEDGKEKKSAQQETIGSLQIPPPTTEPLQSYTIPIAGAAAAAAQPYLGIEALSIYFHMIGTITAMVSPKGDSLTEFTLNAPSFANSKFYGAKISIERFSTAPYQLNIRLTGSNEAVAAFNQSIPNLLAAFRAGKFSYTVNRIDTAYEKPLFHRKESAGGNSEKRKDFGGGKK